MKLNDRIALVTGASSGIGRGISLEFAREGARVAVVDIQETPRQGIYHETKRSAPTASEISAQGGEAAFFQCDVGIDSELEWTIQAVTERFGGLDILVNNAGMLVVGTIEELSLEGWDRMNAVNLRSAFHSMQLALPYLKNSSAGRIINIASVLAFAGGGGPGYSANKAGLVNLTRDTALEIASYGVTANAICPGYIETPIQDYLTPAEIEDLRKKTALSRFGLPRDIGRAAVFLASEDAEWITGTTLTVDGGFSASAK